MKARKTMSAMAETAQKLREVRSSQPSLSSEEMRGQLEKNRSVYAAQLPTTKGQRSSRG